MYQDAHLTRKTFFVGPGVVFQTPASSWSVEYQSFKVSDVPCGEASGGPYNLIKDGYMSAEGTATYNDGSTPVPTPEPTPIPTPIPMTGPTALEAGQALDILVRFIKARL
jgi:hypothetical protein